MLGTGRKQPLANVNYWPIAVLHDRQLSAFTALSKRGHGCTYKGREFNSKAASPMVTAPTVDTVRLESVIEIG